MSSRLKVGLVVSIDSFQHTVIEHSELFPPNVDVTEQLNTWVKNNFKFDTVYSVAVHDLPAPDDYRDDIIKMAYTDMRLDLDREDEGGSERQAMLVHEIEREYDKKALEVHYYRFNHSDDIHLQVGLKVTSSSGLGAGEITDISPYTENNPHGDVWVTFESSVVPMLVKLEHLVWDIDAEDDDG